MRVATSKVTSQGQISVPSEVRKDLGIRPGTELVWDRRENGEYVVRPKRLRLADLPAVVGKVAVKLSDEELREARRGFLGSRMERLHPKKG
ncbi:MAG: AbrB/MazE/SpoVT family DNA-binding domain-containing protein [Acidobacteria bacterium]|nr:AbrB/MazE/SpoVT family DNA-binding domain-containing protein [Acidobacteriota bacterium]